MIAHVDNGSQEINLLLQFFLGELRDQFVHVEPNVSDFLLIVVVQIEIDEISSGAGFQLHHVLVQIKFIDVWFVEVDHLLLEQLPLGLIYR